MMKTKIILIEGKKFPGFHHYKGKIQQKSVIFSFRICCTKGTPHRLFVKKNRRSFKIDDIPDFHMDEFSRVIEWMTDNFITLNDIRLKC